MAPDVAPPWFKIRRYAHFDSPLSISNASALVTNPTRVASHSFWPLLSFRHRHRLWKKGNADDSQRGIWRDKARPIAYAAHADSHIFAYYSHYLQMLYEAMLQAAGISECVLAYRKQLRDDGSGRGKTNYDFAAEAFAEIASRSSCEVVAIDIKSFFDTIPHDELKSRWKALLGVSELPADHYAVFKAATRFSTVSIRALQRQLGLGLRQYRKLQRIPLQAADFRTRIRDAGLVVANSNKFGIPQGLPISGLLANLLMFDVDKRMHDAAKEMGGEYRRYSDDVLIVAPPGKARELEHSFTSTLQGMPPLATHPDKTLRCVFIRDSKGVLHTDTPLMYLGFEFDGSRVLVRPQTLARFNKRMLRAVRTAARIARKSAGPNVPIRIRRRDLLARFSHLGPHRETPVSKRPRSSFHKYGKRASDSFDKAGLTTHFTSQIHRQLRRCTRRLERLIKEAESGERPQ